MGPGQCCDTLDSHFGDENHQKVIGLGAQCQIAMLRWHIDMLFLGHSLLKKIMDVAMHMAKYTIAHHQLESTLIDPNILKEWTEEIEAWENDPTKPNPFEHEVKGAVLSQPQDWLALILLPLRP